jgi:hypothetical protein
LILDPWRGISPPARVTIVGVLGPDYIGPILSDMAEVYVPMAKQPPLLPGWPLDSYHHWWVEVMGRLALQPDERQIEAVLEVLFQRTLLRRGRPDRQSASYSRTAVAGR